MIRWVTGALLAAVGLSFAACSESGGQSTSSGGRAASGGCMQYTSCAACTPVSGCGWCYMADGAGACADDPNDCSGSPAFYWTWEPNGCHVTADAAVNSLDTGVLANDASHADSAASQVASEAESAASVLPQSDNVEAGLVAADGATDAVDAGRGE